MKTMSARFRRGWRWSGAMLMAWCLHGCNHPGAGPAYAPVLTPAPPAARLPVYRFGIVPLENFRYVYEVYQPIVDYLNANLSDARMVLEVPRGQGNHQRYMRQQRYAFALATPYFVWQSAREDGYRVIAKMGDDSDFHSMLVVRRDSGITTLAHLRHKTLSLPPQTALAPSMMVRYALHQQGIDLGRDMKVQYVASQHVAIMQAYLGQAQAGATWPAAWRSFQQLHPREAQQLVLRFPTEPLVNQGVLARADVPPELARRVATLLVNLHRSDAGRAMLARLPLSRFEPATKADFDDVGRFVQRYERTFGGQPR